MKCDITHTHSQACTHIPIYLSFVQCTVCIVGVDCCRNVVNLLGMFPSMTLFARTGSCTLALAHSHTHISSPSIHPFPYTMHVDYSIWFNNCKKHRLNIIGSIYLIHIGVSRIPGARIVRKLMLMAGDCLFMSSLLCRWFCFLRPVALLSFELYMKFFRTPHHPSTILNRLCCVCVCAVYPLPYWTNSEPVIFQAKYPAKG